MKKSLIIKLGFLFTGIFMLSCEKQKIETPQFDVKTDSTSYKKGTTVTFNFTGSAQNVAFWSGEKGHIYANRNRTEEQGNLQYITFTSAVSAGTQNSNLSVLMSRDFNGTCDPTNIALATWTDITSRAILASTATPGAGIGVVSGNVDITDLGSADNTPVYFAFRYLSLSDGLIPRAWTIGQFTIVNRLTDLTVNTLVANQATAGFRTVDVQNATYQWVKNNYLNPTSMVAAAGPIGTVNEDWAISKPIRLNNVALVDYGVPVMSISTLSPPSSYAYAFAKAGTYKVTFYAFNENLDDTEGIAKELTITITP